MTPSTEYPYVNVALQCTRVCTLCSSVGYFHDIIARRVITSGNLYIYISLFMAPRGWAHASTRCLGLVVLRDEVKMNLISLPALPSRNHL